MVRIFQNPDGTVRVLRLNERRRRAGEADAEFFARVTAKQPDLAALPFVDVPSVPVTRARRHAWRLLTDRVIVDVTVPDPPNPRAARNAAIAAAATLDQLKTALLLP